MSDVGSHSRKRFYPKSEIRHLKSLFLFLAACFLARAEDTAHWRLQYFYDQAHSTFVIADLKFPSPQRGIAVGAIAEGKTVKPMSALTNDGGAHWSLVPLKEAGESLFFLNDSLGWLVTTKRPLADRKGIRTKLAETESSRRPRAGLFRGSESRLGCRRPQADL